MTYCRPTTRRGWHQFNFSGQRIQVRRKSGGDSNKMEASFGTTNYNANNEMRILKLAAGDEPSISKVAHQTLTTSYANMGLNGTAVTFGSDDVLHLSGVGYHGKQRKHC